MNTFKRILPHLSIILASMTLVFTIISQFNGSMGYMSHGMTRFLLLVFSVVSIVVSCMLISRQRREG